jgi:hypothetical protein
LGKRLAANADIQCLSQVFAARGQQESGLLRGPAYLSGPDFYCIPVSIIRG